MCNRIRAKRFSVELKSPDKQCPKPQRVPFTSSAGSSADCGIVRPSAFVVLRLIPSTYLVGCSILMEYPVTCSVDLQPECFDDRRPEGNIGCEGPPEFFGGSVESGFDTR